MKVVINRCFGGFGLSPRAVKRLAELNGRQCYFFVSSAAQGGSVDIDNYEPITLEELEMSPRLLLYAFDIPNPNEVLKSSRDWSSMTDDERKAHNEAYEAHEIANRDVERNDPRLVQVVEELGGGHGEGASGRFAELKVVEIPDGVEYTIEEYDGLEHIAEKHRTWA